MKTLILLLISSSFTCISFSQNNYFKIASLLNSYGKMDVLNGTVLVVENEKIIYKGAFGYANFNWNIKNTVNTKFKIASISKQFTAVLVLLLCQEGKLNFEGRVSDYLPGYPNGEKMTIHQLLNHTSGIIDQRDIKGFDNTYGMQKLSRTKLLDLFKDSALLFEPGSNWYYSNFNYNLLAVLTEKVMHKELHTLLKEKIFQPRGMLNTITMDDEGVITNYADGYERNYADLKEGQYFDVSTAEGSGNVISTVEDLYLFFTSLKNKKILNEKYTNLFFTPTYEDKKQMTYGFSTFYFPLKISRSDSTIVSYYSGSHFGIHTLIYDAHKGNKMVIVLLNIKSQQMFEIADNILNILYHIPFDPPKDSYVRLFANDIKTNGIDYAIIKFKTLKKQYGDLYMQKPRDLNRLGYYYLNNDPSIAVLIFKLNIECYPAEGDFYDSLGEGYMILGDKQKAITNLKKAIEINPANDHARELLVKLSSQ